MNLIGTNQKGDFAKAMAVSALTKMGYRVGFLLTESAPYDLFVDTYDGLKRVSVKYLGSQNGSLSLRNIHTNAQGTVVRKTKEDDYDWLYIYKSDGKEYLYKKCLIGRNAIKPTEDYLIAT